MKKTILDKNITIAIIGFGRFGRLLVQILLKHSKVKIILISQKRIQITHKNLELKSIKHIGKADVIIPCVPISSFESVIKKISPIIKKDAIIIDVCSVKMLPVCLMKKYLPETVQIIASHPMFGPDSYRIKKRLKRLKLVLWNITAIKKNFENVKRFCMHLGLKIIEISPKKHDEFMAFSLGYSYLVGKISQRMGIKNTPIDTYDFQLLLNHRNIIQSDTEQLFIDMQTKNPYATDMFSLYKKTFIKLQKEIKSYF